MAKKAAKKIKAQVISNPGPGDSKPVRTMMPTMTVGTLCSANGTALTPPDGFQLVGVWAYIKMGQDTPATQTEIQTSGVKISSGPALPWTANQVLQAFLPSMPSNPDGWNTLHLLYLYFNMTTGMPGTPQTESVSFKGTFTQLCPMFAAPGSNAPAPIGVIGSRDIQPDRKVGKTYYYRNVPVNYTNGVRLMDDSKTPAPLHAKLVEVAATKVDWTPDPLLHANLHRPVGQLELYREHDDHWWELRSRFRLMPRNAIVIYQPSSSTHAVIASSMKQPDVLEFFNPVLDLYVLVNDFVDPSGVTDQFADNQGYFDLVVKVLKKF